MQKQKRFCDFNHDVDIDIQLAAHAQLILLLKVPLNEPDYCIFLNGSLTTVDDEPFIGYSNQNCSVDIVQSFTINITSNASISITTTTSDGDSCTTTMCNG